MLTGWFGPSLALLRSPGGMRRYLAQNEQQSTSGMSVFSDPAWLRRIGIPSTEIPQTIAAFARLAARFRAASAELLRSYGLSDEAISSRVGSREMFTWCGETPFLSRFILHVNVIILPRQARDTHGKR
eukprot:COSAG06_NODE_6133_length_3092_cov_1.235884_2_plen_128_part_00